MGFDFKRSLRRATFMAMMDEEKRKKEPVDPAEQMDREWLDMEGLDYDELQEMSTKERNKLLREHDLDPDDFSFENYDFDDCDFDDDDDSEEFSDPLEQEDRYWLDLEGLDYDELKEMSKKKRNRVLRTHALDPDDFNFTDDDDDFDDDDDDDFDDDDDDDFITLITIERDDL